ncbi:MAG TPA: undecaprenyl-diphosphate phosphatase [Spirochaetia bacterium]|nr:undecaprenyl-diphosphate phosphatase [Spirochaetia bacterium]
MKRNILCAIVVCAVIAMPLLAQEAPAFRAGTGESAAPSRSSMSIPQALILGIVEGVTEYLPVSSTGHLNVVQSLLGLWATPEEKSASDAYAICIQAGAIIAVFLISFGRIRGMVRGIVGQDREGLRLFGNVVVAFIPAALIGLVLEETIKRYLYGIWPIVGAWLVGGIFILAVMTGRRGQEGRGIEGLTWRTALLIGLAQVLSLWPGVSRSLVTIAGGIFVGLSVPAAVEFSFLLGLVTLGVATIYEGLKLGHLIVTSFGWVSPVIGLLAAAVSAFIAVRWMIGYLRTRSLAVFGWYRVAIAVIVTALVFAGIVR